uniref:Zinc finger protein n=1 Tax=Caenorhabditis tropicalis TaxID=1561998 RepID=A0A1I7T055_9PELO
MSSVPETSSNGVQPKLLRFDNFQEQRNSTLVTYDLEPQLLRHQNRQSQDTDHRRTNSTDPNENTVVTANQSQPAHQESNLDREMFPARNGFQYIGAQNNVQLPSGSYPNAGPPPIHFQQLQGSYQSQRGFQPWSAQSVQPPQSNQGCYYQPQNQFMEPPPGYFDDMQTCSNQNVGVHSTIQPYHNNQAQSYPNPNMLVYSMQPISYQGFNVQTTQNPTIQLPYSNQQLQPCNTSTQRLNGNVHPPDGQQMHMFGSNAVIQSAIPNYDQSTYQSMVMQQLIPNGNVQNATPSNSLAATPHSTQQSINENIMPSSESSDRQQDSNLKMMFFSNPAIRVMNDPNGGFWISFHNDKHQSAIGGRTEISASLPSTSTTPFTSVAAEIIPINSIADVETTTTVAQDPSNLTVNKPAVDKAPEVTTNSVCTAIPVDRPHDEVDAVTVANFVVEVEAVSVIGNSTVSPNSKASQENRENETMVTFNEQFEATNSGQAEIEQNELLSTVPNNVVPPKKISQKSIGRANRRLVLHSKSHQGKVSYNKKQAERNAENERRSVDNSDAVDLTATSTDLTATSTPEDIVEPVEEKKIIRDLRLAANPQSSNCDIDVSQSNSSVTPPLKPIISKSKKSAKKRDEKQKIETKAINKNNVDSEKIDESEIETTSTTLAVSRTIYQHTTSESYPVADMQSSKPDTQNVDSGNDLTDSPLSKSAAPLEKNQFANEENNQQNEISVRTSEQNAGNYAVDCSSPDKLSDLKITPEVEKTPNHTEKHEIRLQLPATAVTASIIANLNTQKTNKTNVETTLEASTAPVKNTEKDTGEKKNKKKKTKKKEQVDRKQDNLEELENLKAESQIVKEVLEAQMVTKNKK